jgi:hypothetical protein
MTYQCTVKTGHTGAGNYGERIIYVIAKDIMEAMKLAMQRGGVKKGRSNFSGQSVLDIRQVN